ncbi:MAG: hypothetical protein WCI71_10680, partial [Bacteroidota bacterium]
MDVEGSRIRIFFLLLLVGVPVTTLLAQSSFLTRKVSVDLPSCSLEAALFEIGKAAGFRFSYDADLIPAGRLVSLKAKEASVHALLKEILGKDIRPMELGNYVVLVRNRSVAKEKQSFPDIMVSGVIRDATDRRPLKDATIYEVDNKHSTISSVKGAFFLVIPSGKKVRSLSFCRSGYADTIIFIRQALTSQVDLLLRPLGEGLTRVNLLPGSIHISRTDSLAIVNWLVPRESMVNAQNLEVRTSRTFQASIIPYIGTNWKVTGSVT